MMKPTIGITGLGLLGRGIATCFLSRGYRVIGHSRSEKTRAEAREYIRSGISDLVTRGGMPTTLNGEWQTNYTEAATLTPFAECDFVIESIVEDLNAKRKTFDELESLVRADAVIASNTSALPITLLQQERKHPGRFIGTHWAEPCHLTRFLEVVRGESTTDKTVNFTMQLASDVGKEPTLVKKDIEGFIVNRLGYALYREAFHLLEQGVADAEMIDRATRNALGIWAEVTGPFRWMDLTGLTSYAAVMGRLFPKLSNATQIPPTIQKLIDSGAQGIANGKGFYNYTPEEIHKWEQKILDHVWQMREFAEKHP